MYPMGQIIYAHFVDDNGQISAEPHYALVIKDALDGERVRVMGMTTWRNPERLPPDCFPMPFKESIHPQTGLRRPTLLVGSWCGWAEAKDIILKVGRVPKDAMRFALEIVNKPPTNLHTENPASNTLPATPSPLREDDTQS